MKCSSCHLESERAAIFRSVNRFLKPPATLCIPCFHKEDDRSNVLFFWGSAILAIVSLPLTLYGPTHGAGCLLLNFSTLQFFVLIATIIHELGHVLTALLVGFRAFGIEIGRRGVVYDFLLAGLRWRFRAIPYGGKAYDAPFSARYYKTRYSLIVLAGPLANVVALSIGIALLRFDRIFETTFFDGFVPLLLFTLANAALLPFSLWPFTFKSDGREYANDTLLLWRTWRLTKAQIAEGLWARYWYEAQECRQKKDFVQAQTWTAEGLRHFPENVSLRTAAATNLYLQGKYLEASRLYALLVGRNKQRKDLDALFLNNIAYNALLTRKPELLPRADTCSRLAFERVPNAASYKGTRGSVLVELGKYEEGLKLLHEALKNHMERYAQALNACYIGVAEARQGNLAECRSYFAVARKLNPDCVLLDLEPVKDTPAAGQFQRRSP